MARKNTGDNLPFEQSVLAWSEPKQPAKAAAPAKDPALAAAEARIDEMSRQMSALQQQTFAAVAGNKQQTQDVLPVAPSMNMDGLPDPVDDPKGYAKELGLRTQKFVEATRTYEKAQTSSANKTQGRIQDLWNAFQEDEGNAAYAADAERVEIAAQKAVQNAAARNLNPEQYMFATRETFFSDVKKTYDKLFGKPAVEAADADDDDDTDGEADVIGGTPAASAGAAKKDPSAPPADGMFNSLRDWQTKGGFHA